MATSLRSTVKMSINAPMNKDLDGRVGNDPISPSYSLTYSPGSSAGQANRGCQKAGSIAQGADVAIDLSGDATFKDGFGDAVTFTKVRTIMIKNTSNAVSLLVGGNANLLPFIKKGGAAIADSIVIRPGGAMIIDVGGTDDGYAVTAGTSDIIQLAHGGDTSAAVTYELTVIGVS